MEIDNVCDFQRVLSAAYILSCKIWKSKLRFERIARATRDLSEVDFWLFRDQRLTNFQDRTWFGAPSGYWFTTATTPPEYWLKRAHWQLQLPNGRTARRKKENENNMRCRNVLVLEQIAYLTYMRITGETCDEYIFVDFLINVALWLNGRILISHNRKGKTLTNYCYEVLYTNDEEKINENLFLIITCCFAKQRRSNDRRTKTIRCKITF